MNPLPGLGCHGKRHLVEVGLIGGPQVKAGIGSLAIINTDVATQRNACFADGLVGPEVDLLVLDGPLQPFDEDVVASRAAPVYADGDAVYVQLAAEGLAGKLVVSIGIE